MSADPRTYIGLDLGGTKLAAALCNDDLEILERRFVTVAGHTSDSIIDTIAYTVDELATRSTGTVTAVGIGVPSTIDRRTDTIVMSANLPLADVALANMLHQRTGLPFHMDNDATMAAVGEQRAGAGQGASDMIMLTLGTGVGGGIIIDGEPFSGAIGGGGELGHFTIDLDGPDCPAPNCPGRGCFEAFCSGSALGIQLRDFVRDEPSSELAKMVADGAYARGELVVDAARAGDTDARMLLERLGVWLGVGMTSLVNIFNPEVIVVGGGLGTSASDVLIAAATEVVTATALPPARDFVRVLPATLGTDAGMVGAAVYARDRSAVAVGS